MTSSPLIFWSYGFDNANINISDMDDISGFLIVEPI